MNDDFIQALLHDFVEEARPMTERLGDAFLRMERCWSEGAGAGSILPQVKSDLHTLKGNSGLMGLTAIQSLTHAMEDLCGILAGNEAAAGPEIAGLLLDGGDLLGEMVELSARGELTEDHASTVLNRLESAVADLKKDTTSGIPSKRTAESGTRKGPVSDDLVRIDFRKLDSLLEMVGEAMISRSMLADAHASLGSAGRGGSDLDRAMQLLERSLQGLQEGLVQTRLLPVATVFRRFVRHVRDQALKDGKLVHLETTGADTTIDKTIIDRLGEPVLHLVRNAVAHGIETAAERSKAGKPEEGTVTLSAEQVSDRVLIAVSDDGRGLDESKIISRAKKLGYDTESLDRPELLRLIFEPGFSTADGVSTLAGRGVGLDVVASSIEALGGAVYVDNRPGLGATFRLDLPLTLAVVQALFVEVTGELYAIPLSYVLESFRLDPSTAHTVDHRQVVSWRDEWIPLLDGRRLLGSQGDDTPPYCVVIGSGARRCGLLVHSVHSRRDVVVKGLDDILGQQDFFSGVTTLGDGQVVFILDATALTSARHDGACAAEGADA